MLSFELLLSPASQLFWYAVLVSAVFLAVISVYRIAFHPLANYPGPLSYKLSGWPLLWQAYKGNRHIWHLKDHEKYGPIVRITPNTLSFSTQTALNTIYGARNVNVKKGEWYKTFDIAAGTYSSFTETDKDKHAVKRRWLNPVFSDASQRASEPVIQDIIKRFCDFISPASNGWSQKQNAAVLATYLGFDIMGALVFGYDFKTVHERENRAIAESVLPATMCLYWISYLPLAWLVRPLLRTRFFELVGGKPVADNNRLIDYAIDEVRSRTGERADAEKSTSLAGKDYLAYLASSHDRKTGWRPTLTDLDSECLNLINAGADPYSGVLAGIFFYLVHNEPALHKATSEVRSTFGSADDIRNDAKLSSCTYLLACIEETLRRTAPVPSHLPRIVLPGGLNIDGEHIPAGTVVGVPMYAIHHSATYFPEPWSFRPERWIESESVSRESIEIAKKAFEPFGLGVRRCSGMSVAYLQLKLTLAHLLFRFDIRLAPDEPGRGGGSLAMEEGRNRKDEFQMWDGLGFGRDGPMVQFKTAQTN